MPYNTHPEKDLLLCYIVDYFGHIPNDKEMFMPAVAHYDKDGKIDDFMFDSFIFLSQPNYLYNYLPEGPERKALNKEHWLDFIANEEFAPGLSIDALDEAVGEAKRALGDTNYRANVFMSLLYPEKKVTEFGEVDGKMLDFRNLEDRKTALKWMVDESLTRFYKRNYENVRMAGFYWFCEEMDFEDHNRELAVYITDYIRSRGCKTCWCPWFGAPGWEEWRELGFDIATQQANYFPEHRKDWPNRGTEERLPMVVECVKKYHIGVGMEMSDSRFESAEVFKQYLITGARDGFMHYPHIYYMGRGPKVVREIYQSADPRVRTVYDELYKYIHRTLEPSDVQTEF